MGALSSLRVFSFFLLLALTQQQHDSSLPTVSTQYIGLLLDPKLELLPVLFCAADDDPLLSYHT